jgi:hypothetical protein
MVTHKPLQVSAGNSFTPTPLHGAAQFRCWLPGFVSRSFWEIPMTQAPKWLSVAAFVALLWNILGCIAFFADLQLSPEDVAKLPEAQQALYAARPAWSVAATGIAVLGGAVGCIALLMKRKWAFVVLVLSLVGIIAQDISMFLLVNGAAVAGNVAVILQANVLLVGIWLVLLSRKAIARNWLS